MLSLLSLLLASGTVLKSDTIQWTPHTYPDPRVNYTECNSWLNSTLCDPDHILSEQWRQKINTNLNKLMIKLRTIPLEYQDRAPTECYDNTTDSIQLYIILAKRIQAANNQTITEADLTKFGDGLVEEYALRESACKNFLIFIGVEAAKMAYVRTGSDLKLSPDLMQQIFNQYNLFKAKNFTEVLNKIIDEIGEKIVDPYQPNTLNGTKTETDDLIRGLLTINETVTNGHNISSNTDSLAIIYNPTQPTSWWMTLMTCIICCLAFMTLILLLTSMQHNRLIKQLGQNHNCKCKKANNSHTISHQNNNIAHQFASKIFNTVKSMKRTTTGSNSNESSIDNRLANTI